MRCARTAHEEEEEEAPDFTVIASQWLHADVIRAMSIAERGVNQSAVSLAEIKDMLSAIPPAVLDSVALTETAASIRGFTRMPRKNLPAIFARVHDLCVQVEQIYANQNAASASGSGRDAVAGDVREAETAEALLKHSL